mmetsp:Transcript_5688/g.35386  ORF Transcript_5688/g.35386 Transcript_5688/m.35386 type:complete len:295 (-) Transcript_5688:455-1339(-)
MPHLQPLRLQVLLVLRMDLRVQRDALRHPDPILFQARHLGRIVGHETHGLHPEVGQYLSANGKIPRIDGMPQVQVRFHCIPSLVLEVVGTYFLRQPDAPSFVTAQIHHHAGTFLFQHVQGSLQLRPTITALGSQNVPRQAFRVKPRQHVLAVSNVPFDDGHVLHSVQLADVCMQHKVPVFRWHLGCGHLVHLPFRPFDVLHELVDGDHAEPVGFGELVAFSQAHDGSVVVHELAKHASRDASRQPRQIHGSFGVSTSCQHASGLRSQREHVSRSTEGVWRGVWIGECMYGFRTI